MATLTTLEEDVLHLICEHLPTDALRSASLAHRALSQVYLRHRLRHLEIVTSLDDQSKKIEFLDRWDRRDCLKHVWHLTINDTSKLSQHGDRLLRKVFSQTLPKLTGLRTITWNAARNSTWKSKTLSIHDFCTLKVPSNVKLFINYRDKNAYPNDENSLSISAQLLTSAIPNTSVQTLLSKIPNLRNLVSLEIETVFMSSSTLGLLKNVLLASPQLQNLELHNTQSIFNNYSEELEEASRWTAWEVARFPPLKRLDLTGWHLDKLSLLIWAAHGDWSNLESIAVKNDWMVQYMVGRTPRLNTLIVDELCPWLPEFLAEAPKLSTLIFTSLQQGPPSVPFGWTASGRDANNEYSYRNLTTKTTTKDRDPTWKDDAQSPLGKKYADVTSLLKLPFASKLQGLRFNLHHGQYQSCEQPVTVGIEIVASLCPQLTDLTIAIAPELYRPRRLRTGREPRMNWFGPISKTVAKMSHLNRLEIIIPRRLQFRSFGSCKFFRPRYVTMVTLHRLLTAIQLQRPPNPPLSELSITCVLGPSSLDEHYQRDMEPEILNDNKVGFFGSGKLTYVAKLSENEEEAKQGRYILSCPELEEAERALKQGNKNWLLEDPNYKDVKNMVDDLESLAYRGVLNW